MLVQMFSHGRAFTCSKFEFVAVRTGILFKKHLETAASSSDSQKSSSHSFKYLSVSLSNEAIWNKKTLKLLNKT